MSASVSKKMEVENEERQPLNETVRQEAVSGTQSAAAREDAPGELNEQRWAVISFAEVAGRGLSYAEAVRRREELQAQGVFGLCIVTDEAANRFLDKT